MAKLPLADRVAPGAPPLGTRELAEYLNCSRRWIQKLILAKTLRAGRVGLDYRVPADEARRLAREVGAL